MERFPAFAGPSSAPDADDAPAHSRYNRDASYALGLLPRLATLEGQAMAMARARALPDGGGLADRFDALFGGGVARVLDQAPTPEARAMTEVLAERPRRRAEERALVTEAVQRTDHFRRVLDDGIAATRARINADPAGAEDSFGDLLDGITLAADGWLGHEEGERLARDLEGELFRDAAHRLIARDPADAAERLDGGLWSEHFAPDERERYIYDARARAEARAADDEVAARRAARQAEIDSLSERAHTAAELTATALEGTARREDIARAVTEGRLRPGEEREAITALARAEDESTARAAAVARVEDFLGAGIVEGEWDWRHHYPDPPLPRPGFPWPTMPDEGPVIDGRPLPDIPPIYRPSPPWPTPPTVPWPERPEPHEVELWWEIVFGPAVGGLPQDAREAAEDRVLRRLGRVPEALLRTLRAALYGRDPAAVVKGAVRLVRLLDDLPADAVALRGREAEAARTVAAAARAMPDAETAVEFAAHSLGAAEGTIRDALLRTDAAAAETMATISPQVRFPGRITEDEGIVEEEEEEEEEGEPEEEPENGPQEQPGEGSDDDDDDLAEETEYSDLAARARAADPDQPGPTPKIIEFLTGAEAAGASDDELKEAAKQLGLDPEAIKIMRDIRWQRKNPAEIADDINHIFREELFYQKAFLDINAAAAAKKTQAERDVAVSRLNAHAVTDDRNVLAPTRQFAAAAAVRRGLTARQKGQIYLKSLDGKPAPVRRQTPEETKELDALKKKYKDLRTRFERRKKPRRGSNSDAVFINQVRGAGVQVNRKSGLIYERLASESIEFLVPLKLAPGTRMTTKSRDVTYSDRNVDIDGHQIGFFEFKSGKAKDGGRQKQRQEEYARDNGLLRVVVEEGRPIKVTGEVDTRRPTIGGVPLWIPENDDGSVSRQERKENASRKN